MKTDLSLALVLSNAREAICGLLDLHEVAMSGCVCRPCERGRSTLALIDAYAHGPLKPPGVMRVPIVRAEELVQIGRRLRMRVIDGGRA